jgi:hypothetical protein
MGNTLDPSLPTVQVLMGVHEYHGANPIVVCLTQEEAVIALRRLLDWKTARPSATPPEQMTDAQIEADRQAEQQWLAAFPFPGITDPTFDFFQIEQVNLIGTTR